MPIEKGQINEQPSTYNSAIAALKLSTKFKRMSIFSGVALRIELKAVRVSCDRMPEFGVIESCKYL